MITTTQIIVRLIISIVFGLIISIFVKREKTFNFKLFPLLSLLACFNVIFILEVFFKIYSKIELALLPAALVLGLFWIIKPIIKKSDNEEEILLNLLYLLLTLFIGFCLGFGFYKISIFTTLIVLILITIFPYLENLFNKKWLTRKNK